MKEKEKEIQNLYLEGKKSANDLTERDHRNKQEKNGYLNRISELEKSLSDKILEKEYISKQNWPVFKYQMTELLFLFNFFSTPILKTIKN